MGAPFRACDRVHLVDDHGLDAAEDLAALRGQEKVERLRGGDEDVRRRPQHLTALPLVGVSGADADRQFRVEAGQRPPEIALDVVVECLQRRDVEEPQPLAGARGEPVDADQERCERLPGTGRCLHEDVGAGGNRGPGRRLGRRRPGERTLEPGARLSTERGEWIHLPRVTRERPDRIEGWCRRNPSTSRATRKPMPFWARTRSHSRSASSSTSR